MRKYPVLDIQIGGLDLYFEGWRAVLFAVVFWVVFVNGILDFLGF